jgi:Uma2 family endonuclease
VLLLVEAADSSMETDSGAKRELYARAAIREYWIVDLTTDCVIVHREPGGGRYNVVTRIESTGTLDIQDMPDVTFPAASLFA